MRIGGYEAVECEKPTGVMERVRQVQTEHGPVDFFANFKGELLYMRAWLNREGMNEIIWYQLEE